MNLDATFYRPLQGEKGVGMTVHNSFFFFPLEKLFALFSLLVFLKVIDLSPLILMGLQ